MSTDNNYHFTVCANKDVASNLGGRHAVFEFDQTRNSKKDFTA